MPQVKIRIEKTQGQQAISGSMNQQGTSKTPNVAVNSAFAHQMMGVGKQIISYGLGNVGFFTGDYVKQDEINTTLDLMSDVATIGMGFVVGNIAGGIVAIAGVATKRTLQGITDRRRSVLEERERNYWLARSGNSTKNGSRGTEN